MTNAILSRNYIPLIFELRGMFIMLDADLAVLYGVETKRLKEQGVAMLSSVLTSVKAIQINFAVCRSQLIKNNFFICNL